MKTHAVWVDGVRLSKRRKDILKLCSGDEAVLHQLERAVAAYLALAPAADFASETKSQIRADLKRLADALVTLNDFFDRPGSARALFMGESADKGVLKQAVQLEAALDGVSGNLLIQSAQSALEKWTVSSGRGGSQDTAGRLELVRAIAAIVEPIGIQAKRDGVFVELVQAVYESVGITNDRGEVIKVDGDIRKAGF